ncbi:putative peptidoglycan binding domain-containing protein, partial [Geobacillus sp. WSUCF1]
GGYNDRYIDLRVDDHPRPIEELIRLYQLRQLYFEKPRPEKVAAIEGTVKEEVAAHLVRLGYLSKERSADLEALHEALTVYIHTENFEERQVEKGKIDLDVLQYMKQQPSPKEVG